MNTDADMFTTINADGPGEWMKLPGDGDNVKSTIFVGNPDDDWDGTLVELEYCPLPSDDPLIVVPLRVSNCEPGDISFRSDQVGFFRNGSATIKNIRGHIRMVASNFGNPVTMRIL